MGYWENAEKLFELLSKETELPDTEEYIIPRLLKYAPNIKEICDEVRTFQIFHDGEDHRKKYLLNFEKLEKDAKLILLWKHFVVRFIQAPTSIHTQGVIILILPLIDDMLTTYPQK